MSTAAEQAQAAGGVAVEAGALDQIFNAYDTAIPSDSPDDAKRLRSYFEEYVKLLVKPGQTVSKDVERTVKFWIAEIDKKLSAQLNEVLHHADFQRLEGSWRGLHYLVDQTETGEMMKVKVMNISKRDLFKDLEKAVEFDQSQLFKKVYEDEYGTLGGSPYGMLVGDYDFGRGAEDISMLKKLGGVASAAHAPFVAAAGAKMFGMEKYTQLPNPRDLAKIFEGVEYTSWKSFRDSEDSRYVALAMPRVLGRLPFGEGFKSCEAFNYEEGVDGKDHDKYLWMNAAWAYAARITDAVSKFGWMARTRGVEGGGKVENLPIHYFPTDEGDTVMKCPTEIAITDRRENELSTLGFLPLLHCKNSDYAAFLGAQSCNKPKKYFDPDANANAELSAKFNYMMCVGRFSHYLKVILRDKIGSFMEVSDLSNMMNDWINNFVLANPELAGEELKAQKPLKAASIEVTAVEGKPGWYQAVAHLSPHFQLEGVQASMRLVAQVKKAK